MAFIPFLHFITEFNKIRRLRRLFFNFSWKLCRCLLILAFGKLSFRWSVDLITFRFLEEKCRYLKSPISTGGLAILLNPKDGLGQITYSISQILNYFTSHFIPFSRITPETTLNILSLTSEHAYHSTYSSSPQYLSTWAPQSHSTPQFQLM